MKWITPEKPKETQHGDLRVRRKFAFLPTSCSDGRTVWLEFYYVEERFEEGASYDGCWAYWGLVRSWTL